MNALKSLNIIRNILLAVDTSEKAVLDNLKPEMMDSICNSYKSLADFREEKDYKRLSGDVTELNNELSRYSHFIGQLTVNYTSYKMFLLKIDFNFKFRYYNLNGKSYKYTPSQEFMDSLKVISDIPLEIKHTGPNNSIAGFNYCILLKKSKEQVLKYEKDLILDIRFKLEDADFQIDVNFVNDPTNNLEYGFACSVGGSPPEGLGTFAKLVHYEKIYIIEQLLFSANPVTRLMAVDAIEFYYDNRYNYTPGSKILKKMEKVTNESTKISTCWGCFYENLSMKEAYVKAAESKKHLYDNFFFIDN